MEPPSVEPRLQWPGPVKQPQQPSEAADATSGQRDRSRAGNMRSCSSRSSCGSPLTECTAGSSAIPNEMVMSPSWSSRVAVMRSRALLPGHSPVRDTPRWASATSRCPDVPTSCATSTSGTSSMVCESQDRWQRTRRAPWCCWARRAAAKLRSSSQHTNQTSSRALSHWYPPTNASAHGHRVAQPGRSTQRPLHSVRSRSNASRHRCFSCPLVPTRSGLRRPWRVRSLRGDLRTDERPSTSITRMRRTH